MSDSRQRLPWLVLGIGLAAFHAAWLDSPFGMLQINAGPYFGVFCKNWERFGFWELRGLPLLPHVLESVAQGFPYVHHPPGLSWLFHALGGGEWSMRLPTVVASFVAAVAWHGIARTRFGPRASYWSSWLLALSPCFAVIAQASYEPLVIACGLVVMREIVSPVANRRRSAAIQFAAAFAGTWVDWGFGFLGLACVPLAWCRGDLRATVRRLLVPGAGAVAAAATIVAWSQWALAAPGIQRISSAHWDLFEMLANAVNTEGRSFTWLVDHLAAMVPFTWSWWLVGTFVFGIGFAFWRYPRLAIATAMVAVGPYALLMRPGDHIWHTYSAPMVAVAGAAALDVLLSNWRRWVRVVAGLVAVVVLAGEAWYSWRLRADSASSFFERMGAVLSEAASTPGWGAGHGHPFGLPYYFDSPRILLDGCFLPWQLEPLIHPEPGMGW